MDERESEIRERAYQIWEEEARPQGKASAHWEQACKEIETEHAGKMRPAGKKAPKKAPKASSAEDDQTGQSPAAGDSPGNH